MVAPQSLFPSDDVIGLVTDFYELTMAAGYWSLDHNPRATFEAFVRTLPKNRQYLIAAGLEQVVQYVRNLRFTAEQIRWLRQLDVFSRVGEGFWEYLSRFRFGGDIWAVPEGTIVFADEPVVSVSGQLIECQLLETYLLTVLNIQTLVATKASRICHAADGRAVVDFGARRAHGPQAGLFAARASFIGGCSATSNVYAAKVLDIPPAGTQAHSWIMSFDTEQRAFEAYAEVFPENTICLIDTYDTLDGARRAAKLGRLLKGVRLDSGDLALLSRRVRAILDHAGLTDVKIVASSDLNEYTISELLARGAAIDLFGVGTDMVTSKDDPALSIVYKLVELADDAGRVRPVWKSSTDKATRGGAKQTFRQTDAQGRFCGDVVGLIDETISGEPLMTQIVDDGQLVTDLPDIRAIRRHTADQLASLPVHLRNLRGAGYYPVELSATLRPDTFETDGE